MFSMTFIESAQILTPISTDLHPERIRLLFFKERQNQEADDEIAGDGGTA